MINKILNNNFTRLDEKDMVEINGGEDTAPTVTFWLWNIIKKFF